MPIDQIKRREFITLLGGAAAGWPLAARAQQPAKTARIGYLAFRSPIPADDAFLKGLAELGWIEGQNIVIERRFAAGNVEQLKASAGELVRLNVDVIVAAASAPTKVAKEATASIPIVFANAGDPVGQGFVQSRPPLGGIGRARWWMSWTLIAAFHECHEAMLVWPCKDGERQWCTMSDWTCREPDIDLRGGHTALRRKIPKRFRIRSAGASGAANGDIPKFCSSCGRPLCVPKTP